jgi:ribonucleoside-diphosphate reductase beta chain
VEAITTYHLLVEGYLALTGQRTLLRQFRSARILPGFTAGFIAVTRDESRHVGFGVLALRRRITENPEMARVIAVRLLTMLEAGVHVLVAPDRRLAFEDPNDVPPAFRVDPLEARDFAVDSLVKRLRAAGLSAAALAEIAHAMHGHYEAAWSLYEQTHGVRHPVRFWQAGGVARPA